MPLNILTLFKLGFSKSGQLPVAGSNKNTNITNSKTTLSFKNWTLLQNLATHSKIINFTSQLRTVA